VKLTAVPGSKVGEARLELHLYRKPGAAVGFRQNQIYLVLAESPVFGQNPTALRLVKINGYLFSLKAAGSALGRRNGELPNKRIGTN
jgi:hypothetical protein